MQQILKHFFFEHDGKWHHARCDKEILAYRDKSDKAKKSADARWKNANAMRTHSDGNASATVSDANQEPVVISTNVDIKDKREKSPRFDAQAHLLSLGVDSQIANDWIAHRKAKKATPTLTAIVGIVREAEKARISLSDALSISCQRGWVGFEADWIAKDQPKTFTDKRQERDSAQLRAIGWTPEMTQALKEKQQGRLIEGTVL